MSNETASVQEILNVLLNGTTTSAYSSIFKVPTGGRYSLQFDWADEGSDVNLEATLSVQASSWEKNKGDYANDATDKFAAVATPASAPAGTASGGSLDNFAHDGLAWGRVLASRTGGGGRLIVRIHVPDVSV